MPPRARKATSGPAEPPGSESTSPQGNRAGGARRRGRTSGTTTGSAAIAIDAPTNADAPVSTTATARARALAARVVRNPNAQNGTGTRSRAQGRASSSGSGLGDENEGNMSEESDSSDGEVDDESDPPRPPPRTARGKGAASPPRPPPRKQQQQQQQTQEPSVSAKSSRAKSSAIIATQKARAASSTRRQSRATRDATPDEVPEPTGLTSDEPSSNSDLSDDDNFVESSVEDIDDGDADSVDSDDLDDDPPPQSKRKGTKSGGGPAKRAKPAAKPKPASKKGRVAIDSDEEIELEEGQEIAGRIFDAPKAGWVPEGRISLNTMMFLESLMYEENNNREWFKSHEPWFRLAEKEFRAFVQAFIGTMSANDTQIPIMPARDLCHRIYRDIRFAQDKTPYKANFGMTVSRSGRRGIWAGYHLYLAPCNGTMLLAGSWQPDKDSLQRLRNRILASPTGAQALRDAISRPEFVKLFGPAHEHPKGQRQSIFGHSDALKVAPKGVDKTHPEIALLKLRSFVVSRKFTDEEVLAPNFVDRLGETIAIMAPFVHTINNYIAPVQHAVDDSDDDDSGIEIVE